MDTQGNNGTRLVPALVSTVGIKCKSQLNVLSWKGFLPGVSNEWLLQNCLVCHNI